MHDTLHMQYFRWPTWWSICQYRIDILSKSKEWYGSITNKVGIERHFILSMATDITFIKLIYKCIKTAMYKLTGLRVLYMFF